MDASQFLGHLRQRTIQQQTFSQQTPILNPTAKPVPVAASATGSGARIQGHAGKPPFGKDRYPASFAGRPKGAKSKAPNRRQMASALAVAIAMKSGDPRQEADSTAPDFLEKFGVKRNVITRISNALVAGDITINQAVADFSSTSQKAGGGFYSTNTIVSKQQQASTEAITSQSASTYSGVSSSAYSSVPVGQTSSAGGAVAGGEIASTVPTSSVTSAVSTVETPAPSLHGADGAGSNSGVPVGESGASLSAYPSLFGAGGGGVRKPSESMSLPAVSPPQTETVMPPSSFLGETKPEKIKRKRRTKAEMLSTKSGQTL